MAHSFSELTQHLLMHKTPVTIGSGENELSGTIVSFDSTYHVLVFMDKHSGMKHYIPLTSIRSIGVDESEATTTCYLDLFKK
mgnify:CR=1 FL=1